MAKRYSRRKSTRRRFVKRRRFTGRKPKRSWRKSGAGQYARTIESYSLDCTYGQSSTLPPVRLADVVFNDRSGAVAQYYREYRVKWIQVVFKAPYNAYAYLNSTVPYYYMTHDYEGALAPTVDEITFKDLGAKPRAFKKPFKVTWKPRCRYAFQDDVNKINIAKTLKSPWLSTNQAMGDPTAGWTPSQVEHYGLKWFMGPLTGPPAAPTYEVDVRVCFEFRKPGMPYDPAGLKLREALRTSETDAIADDDDGTKIEEVDTAQPQGAHVD